MKRLCMVISIALSSVCFASSNETPNSPTINCQNCDTKNAPQNVYILHHCKHHICRACGKDMDNYCKENRRNNTTNFTCLKRGCGLSLQSHQTTQFRAWLYNNAIPPRSK